MDAISDALERLFGDPHIGTDAEWRPGGATPGTTVRVVLRREDRIDYAGATGLLSPAVVADVRVAEAPTLAEGDVLVVDGTTYVVQGPPRAAPGRLWWTVELVEA